jgi:NAD-dependent dihydropyrimidine dehydrogenase PreA subunit
MKINTERCIGCKICIPYCPVGAINFKNEKAYVELNECVECGTCGRDFVVKCPQFAFEENNNVFERPRSIRKYFSDPMANHVETRIPGRGTEEVKTNDVTGRVKRGEVGIGIEVGRPCVGTNFYDIEHITKSLADIGIEYERKNPLTFLMTNPQKGIFIEDAKKAKVISAIIEFTIPFSKLNMVLNKLKEISKNIETVFSLELITRLDINGKIPENVSSELRSIGIKYRPNAKVNLGLGRPLSEG